MHICTGTCSLCWDMSAFFYLQVLHASASASAFVSAAFAKYNFRSESTNLDNFNEAMKFLPAMFQVGGLSVLRTISVAITCILIFRSVIRVQMASLVQKQHPPLSLRVCLCVCKEEGTLLPLSCLPHSYLNTTQHSINFHQGCALMELWP